MAPSLILEEDTKAELLALKDKGGYPTVEALIRDLIITYRKSRFREVSRKFRKRMDELGLKPEDLWENCD